MPSSQKHRHTLRLAFWEQALEVFGRSQCTLFNNISPTKDHWLSAGSGISGMPYQLIFGKNEIRVRLSLQNSQAEANRFVFERLEAQKADIEADLGNELVWLPLPDKKACRIQCDKAVDGYNKANWPEMIQWLVEHMTRLEKALSGPLEKVRQELKTTNFDKEPGAGYGA